MVGVFPNLIKIILIAANTFDKLTTNFILRTSDESIFKAALKLAERFDVDVWEVKYSYFAALFLDTNLPAGSLEVKLKENEILQDLKERQEDLEER